MLLFGSELKALMHHPNLPRDIDPQAVEDYFTLQYVPDPKSIYKAVHKLPAGNRLLWRRGGIPRLDTWWDLPLNDASAPGDPAALAERLSQVTKARLIADVPLGAFLSGGVDSGAIVSQMAGAMNEPVKTFTIGYDDAPEDESELAQVVATRYGTDHTLRKLEPEDLDLVGRLAAIYDEPFGDKSAMPTFRVAELARRSVTVALSGDGGDEIFAGYHRYRGYLKLYRIRHRLPLGLRRRVFGTIARLYDWAPGGLRGRAGFEQLAMGDLEAHADGDAAIHVRPLRQLMNQDFTRALGGYRAVETMRPHWEKAAHVDILTRLQYTDMKTWLPADILTKVDRASMANSLEVRSPLLDHRLAEWGLNLPRASKLEDGGGKAILKKAMEPYLPHDLLYKPKQGFTPPVDRWMRMGARDIVRDRLTSGRLLQSGYVDPDWVVHLLDRHQGRRSKHGRELWLLLMFQGFLEHDATYGRAP